jgi:hypothetical protein
MKGTWRNIARPIIMKVLNENLGADEKTIRKALIDAYPFGARENHPYKVWLDEINVQRKKRKFGKKNNIIHKDQSTLF